MCPACWSARRAAGDCGGVTHTPNRCHTSEENTLYCHNHREEWPTYQAADGKILDGENKRTRSGLDFNHVRDGMKHSETNMSSPSQEVTEFKYPEAKYLNAQSVGGSETQNIDLQGRGDHEETTPRDRNKYTGHTRYTLTIKTHGKTV